MVKIINPLGDVKTGRQGEAVYQRKYGEQIRRMASPKRAIASQTQIAHRQLYRAALTWRSQLSLANRRYLDGYCIANRVVDSYHIPLPWSRFALKLYLEHVHFIPQLETVQTPPIEAEKKDYNEFDDHTYFQVGREYWVAQTFTPLENYTLGKVKIYVCLANYPGIVTAGIRNTDGEGKPTGSDLATGTTDGDTISICPTKEWREITLTPYDLLQGVKYALVVRAPDAPATNCVHWISTGSDTAYPRGQLAYSLDSASTWYLNPSDTNFEVWSASQEGEYIREGILYVRHPALLTVVHKRGELPINGYDTLSSLDEEYLTGQVGLDVEVGDLIKATTLPGIEYPYQVV